MKRKTSFETPLVLQVAEILLERDMLVGPSVEASPAVIVGQEVEILEESVLDTTWD